MLPVLRAISPVCAMLLCSLTASSDPLPPRPPTGRCRRLPFSAVKAADEAQKPQVMQRQSSLLERTL